jgi:hypothetical protein
MVPQDRESYITDVLHLIHSLPGSLPAYEQQ